jgi:hypothetical protein
MLLKKERKSKVTTFKDLKNKESNKLAQTTFFIKWGVVS